MVVIKVQTQYSVPVYIHPSKNPTIVCVTPQLESKSKYHGWVKRMQQVFATKDKFKFVDGSIPFPPVDDLNYTTCGHCNNLVHSWLVNSMKPQIAENVLYIEHMMDVWNNLK